jgi:hypothetical protein
VSGGAAVGKSTLNTVRPVFNDIVVNDNLGITVEFAAPVDIRWHLTITWVPGYNDRNLA